MTIVEQLSLGRVCQEEGERNGGDSWSRRGTDPALLSRFRMTYTTRPPQDKVWYGCDMQINCGLDGVTAFFDVADRPFQPEDVRPRNEVMPPAVAIPSMTTTTSPQSCLYPEANLSQPGSPRQDNATTAQIPTSPISVAQFSSPGHVAATECRATRPRRAPPRLNTGTLKRTYDPSC
uniref:ZP domain-containing protein n=1 Tax=Heterorhabditis bacteriophora TaxID=37862 RepID=A0A1I7X6N4_HETBA